jgi:hypothetical protein
MLNFPFCTEVSVTTGGFNECIHGNRSTPRQAFLWPDGPEPGTKGQRLRPCHESYAVLALSTHNHLTALSDWRRSSVDGRGAISNFFDSSRSL